MEVLKLSNSNRNIIIAVFQTLLDIIEKLGSKYKICQIFIDSMFTNRISSISNSDLLKIGHKGPEFYSEDVRLHAHHLMEALMINN